MRMKVWFLGAFLAMALFLAGGSSVSAQALDGQWFKLKISVKGYSVGFGEVISKARLKATAYLLMTWNSGMGYYDPIVFCETSPGVWSDQLRDPIYRNFCTEEYIFISDHSWEIYMPDGASFIYYFTGMIKSKFAAPGVVRNAMFSTLGADVYSGTTAEGDDLYGGATVKGKTIDPGKLPFTP